MIKNHASVVAEPVSPAAVDAGSWAEIEAIRLIALKNTEQAQASLRHPSPETV
jgi:predicted DNA-binding protein (UPF0251 family)